MLLYSSIQQKERLAKIWLCVLFYLVPGPDSWLFPKMKVLMKAKCFEAVQDLKVTRAAQLKTLIKEAFQNCFRMEEQSRVSLI